MIHTISSRRGSFMSLTCACALLAGLIAPMSGVALEYDDAQFFSAPPLAAVEQTGTLNYSNDRLDRFWVDLSANQVLSLDLAGAAFQDFDLTIYSPDVVSAPIDHEEFYVEARSNNANTATESLGFLVPPSGTGRYFVEISAHGGATGAYQLTWSLRTALGDAVRISGADRYSTAYAASRSTFTSSSAVVIASGANVPDALAAAGLAGALECPVLLVPAATSLDDPRVAPLYLELTRLGAHDAYIIGGTAAVNDFMYTEIGKMVPSVQRIPGSTRYETAKNVADKIDQINGAPSDTVFVVRGDSFADALAVSPFAYSQRLPILLTPPGGLDAYTRSYIELNDVADVRIAGGTGAVSAAVATSIDSLNSGATDVDRMDGANRYETAAKVAEECVSLGWGDWNAIGLATGMNFPDALSGGAALGTRGGVLLLTETGTLSQAAYDAISGNASPTTIALVLGGTAAVNDAVIQTVRGLLP
ncbi:MAG: cell wall-binding repeat-containing protein [Actinomycetota bacterium]|nr:cell wall-binding repeat-containing protein [Actinomycetota bacterium]